MTECTGLIFRGSENTYYNTKTMSLEHKESFRLLKRKSCNCKLCSYILEDLRDYGNDIVKHSYWNYIKGDQRIVDGDMYKLIPKVDCEGLEEFEFIRIGGRYD